MSYSAWQCDQFDRLLEELLAKAKEAGIDVDGMLLSDVERGTLSDIRFVLPSLPQEEKHFEETEPERGSGTETSGHAWLDSRCWPARHRARQTDTIIALAAFGIPG
jgi:hypothetical protein